MSQTPINKNFLSMLEWRFTLERAPHLNYFVQAVNVPGLSISSANVPTPFVKQPFAGDHIDFGQLVVTFKVDENFENYLEIYNWMVGVAFPDNFEQHRKLVEQQQPNRRVYSDATLSLLTSSKNPNISVVFHNIYPTSLSDLQFDYRTSMHQHVECTASFAISKFSIQRS